MTAAIEVQGLTKQYAGATVVRDVSFMVERGEIFGIIGPNGAGKSTTVECIEGLRKPDAGHISVLGLNPGRDRDELRERVGVQLQDAELPARLRVGEALRLYSSFYAAPADWRALMETLGLTGQRKTQFGKLSGGQRQRLSIALALVGRPEVVVLDELTTGLDPQARLESVLPTSRGANAAGAILFFPRHWSTPDRGGHFMAHEEPGQVASELRAFFGPLRPAG